MVTEIDFNTKVIETESNIALITGLATNSELAAIENKIPHVSTLFKKTDFNTKLAEIEGKKPDVNSLVKENRLCYRNS